MHLNLGTHHLVRKSALLLVAAVSMTTIIVSQPALATTPASHSVGSSSIAIPHFSGSQGTVAAAPTADGKGFWTVSASGTVSVQGDATLYGDASAYNLNGSIVSIAPTFDGRGYWLLGSDGGVFSYGDAAFHGSTGALGLNSPALQMVSTPDSRGYWFVAGDGGIFAFGDAAFHGSTGNIHLNQPVVGMADTRDGGGYWLVASDGGIFAFGNASFHGSTGAISLNESMVGMTSTANSQGYWLVAADGGIFAFGNASFYGSASGDARPGTVVSIVATGDGAGYWIIGDDGNIYSYGSAANGGGAAPPSGGTALSPEFLGETTPISTSSFDYLTDHVFKVNGTTYSQSVGAQFVNYAGSSFGEWDLGRAYNYLDTTIGIADTATDGSQVRFQVFGDGTLLYTRDLGLGQDVPVHLKVTNVLRLKLEVTVLAIPFSCGFCANTYAGPDVFGSAQVTP